MCGAERRVHNFPMALVVLAYHRGVSASSVSVHRINALRTQDGDDTGTRQKPRRLNERLLLSVVVARLLHDVLDGLRDGLGLMPPR